RPSSKVSCSDLGSKTTAVPTTSTARSASARPMRLGSAALQPDRGEGDEGEADAADDGGLQSLQKPEPTRRLVHHLHEGCTMPGQAAADAACVRSVRAGRDDLRRDGERPPRLVDEVLRKDAVTLEVRNAGADVEALYHGREHVWAELVVDQ